MLIYHQPGSNENLNLSGIRAQASRGKNAESLTGSRCHRKCLWVEARAKIAFEPTPAPPDQRFVIRYAQVIANRRAVTEPENEFGLVLAIPGAPARQNARARHYAAQQMQHGLEERARRVPNNLRPGKLLQRNNNRGRDPGQERVYNEEAEPMAGNLPVDN